MSKTGLMRRVVDKHRYHMAAKSVCWLMRIIASFPRYTDYLNFINDPINRICLLILVHFLTSCLTAIKNNVIKYCTTVYERNGKNLFWSIKVQVRFLIN